MILEGTILIFDTRDNDSYVFTKDTKLNHPEKIPVAWNFEFNNLSLIVGTAEVRVSGNVLIATITTTNPMFEQIMMDRTFILCGGYFVRCKEHESDYGNGDLIIDDALLWGIGVSVEDIDHNLFCLTIKEE